MGDAVPEPAEAEMTDAKDTAVEVIGLWLSHRPGASRRRRFPNAYRKDAEKLAERLRSSQIGFHFHGSDWGTEEARAGEARHLRLIANDLRVNGDVQLKRLSEDGVHDHDITLADELWLIALRLDPDHAFEDPYQPDGPTDGTESNR